MQYDKNIGLGTMAFSGYFGHVDSDDMDDIIYLCLKNGITYFETAHNYKSGEVEEKLASILSNFPRKSYFISSTAGRGSVYDKTILDYSFRNIYYSVRKSLLQMRLRYFDIAFVHDIDLAPSDRLLKAESIPALEELKENGFARHIGICGYSLEHLKKIITESPIKIDYVHTYSRYNLFDSSLENYISFFKENNVKIISSSANGMGLLTNKGPPPWHLGDKHLKEKCAYLSNFISNVNEDIETLSMKYTYSNKDIDIHLLCPTKYDQARKCIAACEEPITQDEMALIKTAKDTFQTLPPESTNWEGRELKKLKKKVQPEFLYPSDSSF